MGVLDDIKAISAFNLVEVEVEAELGNRAHIRKHRKTNAHTYTRLSCFNVKIK